ncbi:unnamed protein product [Bemisia tabaci]|uniref:Reverse transcriptase zinc-binding domain-containing protein n=1 Tax=Bemisia tabaci TaxID=7038 RepID=A0A9P0EXA8_BEMTA|nr:unnamed protein product [Bemisia tabaci]
MTLDDWKIGHNLLRKHMHRMGIFKDEPKCRLCEVEEETAEHIIFDCKALEKKRQDIRGDNSWDDCLAPELVAGTLLQLVEGPPLLGLTRNQQLGTIDRKVAVHGATHQKKEKKKIILTD